MSLTVQGPSCHCFSDLLRIGPSPSQTVFFSPPAPCFVDRVVSTSVRFSWQAVDTKMVRFFFKQIPNKITLKSQSHEFEGSLKQNKR